MTREAKVNKIAKKCLLDLWDVAKCVDAAEFDELDDKPEYRSSDVDAVLAYMLQTCRGGPHDLDLRTDEQAFDAIEWLLVETPLVIASLMKAAIARHHQKDQHSPPRLKPRLSR